MKKTSVGLLTLILVGLSLGIPANLHVVNGSSDYRFSGYVLDSNGNGIAGAKLKLFYSTPPWTECYTNDSGYYEVQAKYVLTGFSIYPPSNSNYLKFSQEFDPPKRLELPENYTLSLGYRLSGLVLDQNLNPIRSSNFMEGVGIYLDNYWNGGWADSNGSYYVVAPAGTYTIHARQCRAISWGDVGYSSEYRILNNPTFNLNSDANANIIIYDPTAPIELSGIIIWCAMFFLIFSVLWILFLRLFTRKHFSLSRP